MAGSGRDPHLRRARRAGDPAGQPAAPRSGSAPATTSPSASRTRSGSSRWRGAATTPALYYTGASTRLTPDELSYIVDDCGAKAFISSARTWPTWPPATIADTPKVETRLMVDGAVDGFDVLRGRRGRGIARARRRPAGGHRHALQLGHDRAAQGRRRCRCPARRSAPSRRVRCVAEGLLGFGEDMVYLNPAPLYHAAPLRFTMAVHRVGGTAVVMEHFDPAEALAADRGARDHPQPVGADHVHPHAQAARRGAGPLRRVVDADDVHAAAPCPVEVKRRMIEWFGPVVHEYYAGTEGNGFVYCNSESWLAHPGTVGQNLLGSLHICDDDGNEVPRRRAGHDLVRGRRRPSSTTTTPRRRRRPATRRGGRTLGDVGRLDEDGFLYLTDRKAYMIITGGVNIYPQEAENVLAMHPKVADVAVFGVPNDDFGEEVKAVVQPHVDGRRRPRAGRRS